MDADALQARTRTFAVRIVKLVDALPNTTAGREIGRQLLKSGTSVSANYRAARRARSRKEYIAKIGVVAEEADEAEHWLDLVQETGLMTKRQVTALHKEAVELMKIFAATRRSARQTKSPDRQITKSPSTKTERAQI